MGFFSWKCAKTGLPLMAHVGVVDERSNRPTSSHAVILGANSNGLTRNFGGGLYDGYGRFEAYDGGYEDIESGRVRMVLAGFYEPDADRWDDLPPNQSDPGQGYFHDGAFESRAYHAALGAWAERNKEPLRGDKVYYVYDRLATRWYDRMAHLCQQASENALVQVVHAIAPGWREALAPVVERIRRGEKRNPRNWGDPFTPADRVLSIIRSSLMELRELDRVTSPGSTDQLPEALARLAQKFDPAKLADPGGDPKRAVPLPDPGWHLPPMVVMSGLERIEQLIDAVSRDAVFDLWAKATSEAMASAGHERWWQLPVSTMPEWATSAPVIEVSGLVAMSFSPAAQDSQPAEAALSAEASAELQRMRG